METRANYVLIGSFVLLAAVAFALFAVWMSRVQFNKDYATYDVVFEGAVNGLSEGGEVRFNGIKVGEVTQLALDRRDPTNVIARIRVDAQTPVRADSTAVLDFMGITGMTFIQIRAGDPEEPLLKNISRDDVPRILTEKTQLEELFAGGQDLLMASGETLQRVNAVFTQENIDSLTGLLSNLRTITDAAAHEDTLIGQANAAIASLAKAGDSMTMAADSIDEAAVNFDMRVAQMTNDTLAFLENANAAAVNAQDVLKTADTAIVDTLDTLTPEAERALLEVAVTVQELRLLIARLDDVVKEVERDPREFVLGDAKPFE